MLLVETEARNKMEVAVKMARSGDCELLLLEKKEMGMVAVVQRFCGCY